MTILVFNVIMLTVNRKGDWDRLNKRVWSERSTWGVSCAVKEEEDEYYCRMEVLQ